ncbi:hypothetical protein JI435_422780 [Parastagonospora nodorum SN15]|uniref:Uncharacterized protein n=1 Tax=Phaeosphaeria nodorum (strain SN15 / ATCC MYA-4574 / FGSC 10173) TaxID=321614 RepID=A0A7U2NPJ6_PHANO|nr:hypothetical protein JI435_422780 [Parastagonospora nodorum SN15]
MRHDGYSNTGSPDVCRRMNHYPEDKQFPHMYCICTAHVQLRLRKDDRGPRTQQCSVPLWSIK